MNIRQFIRTIPDLPENLKNSAQIIMRLIFDRGYMKITIFNALIFVVFIGGMGGYLEQTEAGILSSSVTKAAASKAAARSRGAQVRSTSSAVKHISEKEAAALQKVLFTLDRSAIRRIETRYGNFISTTKLRESAKCSTCFLDRQAYDAHLRKSYPNLTATDRNAILGDFKNGRTYVNSQGHGIPTTVAHERLHQLSSNEFKTKVGSRLNEGFTEHFSGRIYRDLAIKDIPVVYPQGQRLVQMMEARLGESRLASAYFSGNVAPLRQTLDQQVGRGAFEKIIRHTERGEFAAAERILLNGL